MYILIGIFSLLILILVFYFLSKGKSNPVNQKNDAEMFARLLVSEIKSFNKKKVESGLQNGNLSESLSAEIEQARRMYKSRIPDADSEIYFDNALLDILADGDAGKFNSGIKSTLR